MGAGILIIQGCGLIIRGCGLIIRGCGLIIRGGNRGGPNNSATRIIKVRVLLLLDELDSKDAAGRLTPR